MRIPDLHRLVPTSGGKPLAVAAERHAPDGVGVPEQPLLDPCGTGLAGRIPYHVGDRPVRQLRAGQRQAPAGQYRDAGGAGLLDEGHQATGLTHTRVTGDEYQGRGTATDRLGETASQPREFVDAADEFSRYHPRHTGVPILGVRKTFI